jgi:cytochrome P450
MSNSPQIIEGCLVLHYVAFFFSLPYSFIMKTLVPPGPSPQAMLLNLRKIRSDPLGFLVDCAQSYGDVVRFPLGSRQAIFINSAEGIKHILQDNHTNYNKDTFQYNALATITGRGLLTNDGDSWLRQRRLAQPAFHRQRLAGFAAMMVASTQRILEQWEKSSREGIPIDVDAEMMRLALEIVGKALFSIDLSREAGTLTSAVLSALDHIMLRARTLVVPPDYVPTPQNLSFRAALATLDHAVEEIIATRQNNADAHQDLLAMLMKSNDADTRKSMTPRQLRDEIITLLIAGHETVASSLTWTWYLLSKHPAVRQRLHSDLTTMLGGRSPLAEDLESLNYLRATINEALRLYPPAWIITRKAIDGDEVSGFPISPGTLIILSPYTIHRHPGYWQQPEGFDPERFMIEPTLKPPRYAYIPFGGGPRLCIGNEFALMESALVMAVIIPRFRLDLLPGREIRVEPLVTLRPHSGLWMNVFPT